MESIYYVMCWQCHRRCVHCYEDRFHPYYGEELQAVVREAEVSFPRVIANFPERMTFRDPADMAAALSRLLEAGASMVGGCCGTTPRHIAAFRPVVEEWNRLRGHKTEDTRQRTQDRG